MNDKQRKTLMVALFVMACMTFVPPWVFVVDRGMSGRMVVNAGYRLVFRAPKKVEKLKPVKTTMYVENSDLFGEVMPDGFDPMTGKITPKENAQIPKEDKKVSSKQTTRVRELYSPVINICRLLVQLSAVGLIAGGLFVLQKSR